jgi:hypothetical protein
MSEEAPPGTPADTPAPAPPKRKRAFLTPAPIDPVTGRPDPGKLNAHQAALRQAVVNAFNAKKARAFLQKHVHHISVNRELSDGIRFLFDDEGRAPRNAPLEDIVLERRRIEYQILWLDGALQELHHRLIKVRELEDYALEMLAAASPSDTE